jgi:acetyltransferase-like isoleucine patch superfamily enzyme
MEDGVFIFKHARIEGIGRYNDKVFHPKIVFRQNVRVQQHFHLTCAQSVIIGENTAIAANVTITDIHHPYERINLPIEKQDIVVKPVEIGCNSKIYNNVVITPGVKIGDHVTIGANSVVTHNIPDYSVAVGTPARVIKEYDFESNNWRDYRYKQ